MKCHQPGKLTRASVPRGFAQGLAYHTCNFQTPKRKAGVQHKPHYLYEEFRHGDWLISYGGETLPKSKPPPTPPTPGPMPARGRPCNQSCFQQTNRSFKMDLIYLLLDSFPAPRKVLKIYGSHLKNFNEKIPGTSLAVQCLGLHPSKAGDVGLIPGRGTKIPRASRHGQKRKKEKS